MKNADCNTEIASEDTLHARSERVYQSCENRLVGLALHSSEAKHTQWAETKMDPIYHFEKAS